MSTPPPAEDAAFKRPDKQLPEAEELAAWARQQLKLGSDRPWTLISARHRLGKLFFEVEEKNGTGSRRLVAKVSKTDRRKGTFDILSRLWKAGLRPPSPYTTVEPVAYLPERKLLLQERAPGRPLLELVLAQPEAQADAAAKAARWLIALQNLDIQAAESADLACDIDKCCLELGGALAARAGQIRRLNEQVSAGLERAGRDLLPSHGDFHPLNIYLADTGRVTGIDLDTFGLRRPVADVAYFLAQAALMGYMQKRSFAATATVRDVFLKTYEAEASRHLPRDVLGALMAGAFVRSLHYDVCILKTDRRFDEQWLTAAERCVAGDFALAE
jgi:hypothetical protein